MGTENQRFDVQLVRTHWAYTINNRMHDDGISKDYGYGLGMYTWQHDLVWWGDSLKRSDHVVC